MAQTVITDFVKIKFDVGAAVSSSLSAFSKERSRVQAQNDTKYYQAVAGGMTFADQLAYRKAQLEEEGKREVPDPDYINNLKQSIADLTKQARYEKIRNTYKSELGNTVGGLESWQSYLSHVKDLLANEQDPDMRAELQSQVQTAQQQVYQANLALVQNEMSKGNADKSIPLLQKALSDATAEKSRALAAGDDVRASSMDANVSAINQSISNIKIDNENNALTLTRARKASAVGYMQNINDLISKSDGSSPIVYQGIAYASEQEYWQTQLTKYVDTNFFSQLQQEYGDYLKSTGAVNGVIPDTVLQGVQSDFTQLSANPVLQPFINRLQVVRSSTLATAVDTNAKAIIDQFGVDDDYNGALAKLNDLKVKYGIDTTSYANQVIQKVAQTKGEQFGAFSDKVNQLVASGLDYNTAVAQVSGQINSGKVAAPVESAKDLVTKTPAQLAKEAPQTTKTQFNQPGVTETPAASQQTDAQKANQPQSTPAQAAGLTNAPTENQPPGGLQMPAAGSTPPASTSVVNPSSDQVYTVKAGDTLSNIARQFYGNPSQYTKIFDANKNVLSNPALIKTGQQLTIPKAEQQAQPTK